MTASSRELCARSRVGVAVAGTGARARTPTRCPCYAAEPGTKPKRRTSLPCADAGAPPRPGNTPRFPLAQVRGLDSLAGKCGGDAGDTGCDVENGYHLMMSFDTTQRMAELVLVKVGTSRRLSMKSLCRRPPRCHP